MRHHLTALALLIATGCAGDNCRWAETRDFPNGVDKLHCVGDVKNTQTYRDCVYELVVWVPDPQHPNGYRRQVIKVAQGQGNTHALYDVIGRLGQGALGGAFFGLTAPGTLDVKGGVDLRNGQQ